MAASPVSGALGGWWGLRRVAQDHMQQQGVWEFPLDLSMCVAGSSVYPGSRVSSWLQCGHFSICAPCCGLSTTVGACHLLWARPHVLWAHTTCCGMEPPAVGSHCGFLTPPPGVSVQRGAHAPCRPSSAHPGVGSWGQRTVPPLHQMPRLPCMRNHTGAPSPPHPGSRMWAPPEGGFS